MELNGKVCILTGASREIGTYIAEHLARKGAHLALAARSEKELETCADQARGFGSKVVTIPTDVTKRTELKTLVKRTTDELGPPDVLVNNAGIERITNFHTMELADIEAIVKTNIFAAMALTRLVLPAMIDRRSGHVVNMSSLAGKTAMPYNVVYSSSKHALVGFSWSLREEMRPYGVGVSVVCPIFVSDAGMFASWSRTRPPRVSGTVSPDQVAAATTKAIERNRAEVLVAPGLGRIVDVFHAISPELTTATARRGGLYTFLHRAAADWDSKD
jgi:short-subunit dehydrogenase